MQIPDWPISTEREIALLREVLASGRWGGHSDFVQRLEREFASFTQCRHGISAMNGTITLEMALGAAGIGPGDEVIVPAISFVSTAMAVSRMGSIPVFVDIEPLSFNMDPERAARAITARTKAIIPVHFGGAIADMDRLVPLAAEYGLALIEDAAHAHGSEWAGRRAGSLGLAGSFSFQNSKVMTAGEGGMLTTNDAEFAERAWSIMDQGRRPEGGWFHHYALGSNYRITGLQAAVLLAQMERLPEQICRRTRNAALLRGLLADVLGLAFQAVPRQQNANSWYLLLGRIDAPRMGRTRDEFHRALTAQGVPCTPFYPHPLYGNPLYQTGGCRVEPCPVAEATIGDAFWLPHRALLGDEDTTREIASAILKASSEVFAS
ncbi:MAG TPA: DegT/DnrJ/EryC1/StrS family aminotransferase [Bryobacteraceae bacterium]|jgi:dTDP-4-amino-4,6-dideoxygalactose transaminase|nr:DegT/DnrJ/EryC1/StrS family aminotransferase [Bryobacteraceae bacterium]